MNIELDGIELNKTEHDPNGGIKEIRYISNIGTSDRSSMVEHDIPGMEGNAFQNLGRLPVSISFDGTFEGNSAKSNLEMLRSKFKQGMPLPFNSNISGAADVTKVLIDDLRIGEVAGIKDRYRYSIKLSEYKEPPPEPVTPPSQDDEAKKRVDELAEAAVEGINYLTGKVLDAEGKPKSGVDVLATNADGEPYKGTTSETGLYRIENLPQGKYKVTVEAEGYEGVEEEVFIGKAGKGEESESEETQEEETEESAEEETQEEETEEPTKEETQEEETEESAEEETQGEEEPERSKRDEK